MSDFAGFEQPKTNWFQVPNSFWKLDLNPHQRVLMLYILRHTWGFHEYKTAKRITLDEFENGRKYADGKRMDKGVNMSRPTIIKHLDRLVQFGYLKIERNDSDKARVEKSFILVMKNADDRGLDLNTSGLDLNHSGKNSLHRTEKDTVERNKRKTDTPSGDVKSSSPASGEIIGAWMESRKIADQTHYKRKHNHDAAKALISDGVTTADVMRFVESLEYGSYEYGRCEDFRWVANNIRGWLDANPLPFGYPPEDDLEEETQISEAEREDFFNSLEAVLQSKLTSTAIYGKERNHVKSAKQDGYLGDNYPAT